MGPSRRRTRLSASPKQIVKGAPLVCPLSSQLLAHSWLYFFKPRREGPGLTNHLQHWHGLLSGHGPRQEAIRSWPEWHPCLADLSALLHEIKCALFYSRVLRGVSSDRTL